MSRWERVWSPAAAVPRPRFWWFVVAGFAVAAALGIIGFTTTLGRAGTAASPGAAASALAYVVLPALIIITVILSQGRRMGLLIAATLLTDAETLLVAALMNAGLAYAVLFPLIGVALVLEEMRGRALALAFAVAAISSIVGVAIALLVGPTSVIFGGAVPALALAASAVFIAFGYGYLWRIQSRTAEAIQSARAEAAARAVAQASAERLTTAVEQAADVVFITDADRRIIYANPAFQRVTGYRLREALGRSIRELVRSDQHDEAFYADLREATSSGRGWAGTIINRRRDGSTFEFEVSMSPIRDDSGRVVGSVSVGRDRAESAIVAERLRQRRADDATRLALEVALGDEAFQLVYQPIVELARGVVVGYEALTRFDSGEPPDVVFADAWRVGLGPQLELATLRRAVAGATALPPARWLDLNVSPALLADRDRLAEVLGPSTRPIVLEITEHQAIADYAEIRDLVSGLGPDIRLAVDDAGAGVANFSHIVELGPDLVKLDRTLVRDVNANLGRQAIVVAMSHFAKTAGCRLVAEGIETAAELETLAELGVEFGQGFLLGRPANPLELARRRRPVRPEWRLRRSARA